MEASLQQTRVFQQLWSACFGVGIRKDFNKTCSFNLTCILNSNMYSKIWSWRNLKFLYHCDLLGVPYFSLPCLPFMPHIPHLTLNGSTGSGWLMGQYWLLDRTSTPKPLFLFQLLLNSNWQCRRKPKKHLFL